IADVIARRRGDIERRWLDRVADEVPGAESLSPSELRDAMPEYLNRLAVGLRESTTANIGGSFSWQSVAREHAEARVRHGFDVDQIIRELVILRHVIVAAVEEEEEEEEEEDGGIIRSEAFLTTSTTIADLIDGAIEAAVKSYIDWRDYQLRRQEAEHIGFLTHE